MRGHGRARGAFAPSLIFLLLFVSRQKVKKDTIAIKFNPNKAACETQAWRDSHGLAMHAGPFFVTFFGQTKKVKKKKIIQEPKLTLTKSIPELLRNH